MEIRAIDVEDLDAVDDIRTRAFGQSEADEGAWARAATLALEAGRYLGAFDGARLVASAHIHDLAQWWNGRPVSMGGVAGVAVAPEDRGRGIGRRLVAATLEHCAELGHPISVLYAATAPLYRGLGWERGGSQHVVSLPSQAVRTVATPKPTAVRRVGPEDAAAVAETIRRVHAAARDCGPIDWGETLWRVWLDDDKDFCYLAEDGFLAYRWAEGNAVLDVEPLIAGSEATLRTLWGIVGSGSSVAGTVRACVAPHDPVFWMMRDQSTEDVHRVSWMLRVVDAPAAIAARGFPAGVKAEVPLLLEDQQRPGNSGVWTLSLGDGRGALLRSEEDPAAVRLSARGLAALFAGTPVTTLRGSGLLRGGDAETDALLTAAFAAAPFILDYF